MTENTSVFHDLMMKAQPTSSIAPGARRAYAVAAALEVIKARATQSVGGVGGLHLGDEFENLAEYATKIQQALEIE
ncbi:hypothetical protein [Microbulbifer sp. MCCC 1A16149]|uniref:hypothetical protein n=1 Tax=Microbulbifer sp. MCCC 1A16149 TaxID=3411322 RepID=UPI003D0EA49A